MASLVLRASFFAAVYLSHRSKLEMLALKVLQAAKRIFDIPDFRYYALDGGIKKHPDAIYLGIVLSPPR